MANDDLRIRKLSSGQISIIYDQNKIEVNKILALLAGKSINITDISTKQPDLEQIFQHLTKAK
jgi:hypothetical protein